MKKAYLMMAALVAAVAPSMFAGTGATPDSPLTVAEAVAVAERTGETVTSESFYIAGYVVSGEISTEYGNATFKLGDEKGVDGGFTAFRFKSFDGEKFTDENLIKVDDFIVVYAPIVNYKGNTPETNYGTLISINGEAGSGSGEQPTTPDPAEPQGPGSVSAPYNVTFVQGTEEDIKGVWVEGYIVGFISGKNYESGAHFSADVEGTEYTNTNLILGPSANTTDVAECIPVALPSSPKSIRENLGLGNNPDMYLKHVKLKGDITKYFGVRGLKEVKEYQEVSEDSAVAIVASDNAPVEYFNLQGIRVANPENGIFVRRQGNNVSKVVIRK